MTERIEAIKNAVVNGKHAEIEDITRQALAGETDPNLIINDALIAAMDVVGQKFADNEIYVPEMLVSALAMKKSLNIIKPILTGTQTVSRGTIMMGTVKGDLHDIGKNLVSMMLEGAGFTVIDLGVNLDVDKLIEQVEKVKPQILGLSALLTTTMPEMGAVIQKLEEKGLRDTVKVMVGGAPVDEAFAAKIGADAYGKDGVEAVKVARRLVGA